MQPLPAMRFASSLLKGQVALVTGAGTGMGRATAIEMARCGADVALLGRRAEPIEDCAKVIRELGRKGFETFTARYFGGNREEATAWLRQRAYERRADTFAERELARRIANGQEVASVELPVYSFDDEGIPF